MAGNTTTKLGLRVLDPQTELGMFFREYIVSLSSISSSNMTLIDNFATEIENKLNEHKADTNNPHKLNKNSIGLDKVENTADAEKNVLSASKLTNSRNINGVAFDGTQDITIEDNTKISKSQIGAINGVAPLDETKKISSEYLPSYVDDILEFDLKSNLPPTGESGKIYVVYGDTYENNGQYRWTGSTYIRIENPIDFATNEEALAGSIDTKAMSPATTKHVTDNLKSTINSSIQAVDNKKVDKVDGKQLSTNDYTTPEKEKLAGLENYNDTEIKSDIAENRQRGVVTATHTLSGSENQLTANLDGITATIIPLQFKATSDYTEGHTFTFNGEIYTAKPGGNETILPNKAFITDDLVNIIVDTESKRLGFKLGGSGYKYEELPPPITMLTATPGNMSISVSFNQVDGQYTNLLDQDRAYYVVLKEGSMPLTPTDGTVKIFNASGSEVSI